MFGLYAPLFDVSKIFVFQDFQKDTRFFLAKGDAFSHARVVLVPAAQVVFCISLVPRNEIKFLSPPFLDER